MPILEALRQNLFNFISYLFSLKELPGILRDKTMDDKLMCTFKLFLLQIEFIGEKFWRLLIFTTQDLMKAQIFLYANMRELVYKVFFEEQYNLQCPMCPPSRPDNWQMRIDIGDKCIDNMSAVRIQGYIK